MNIAIIDDNHFLMQAIENKLAFYDGIKIVWTAEDAFDAQENLIKNHDLDLILMDIEMPEMNGIELTAIVKEKYPKIKIIMLTVFDNNDNIFNAIRAGADGYLLKDTGSEQLHNFMQETMHGGASMSPTIALKAMNLLRNVQAESIPEAKKEEIILSVREIEVLENLSKGLKYAQIADKLFLSEGTIRKHVENIYSKLYVHNRMDAVTKAKQNRII
jgi:DNA-binding NarL/FixJ family response regulator